MMQERPEGGRSHDPATPENDRGITAPQRLGRNHPQLYWLRPALCRILPPEPGADERRTRALVFATPARRAPAQLVCHSCEPGGAAVSLCPPAEAALV